MSHIFFGKKNVFVNRLIIILSKVSENYIFNNKASIIHQNKRVIKFSYFDFLNLIFCL